MSQAHGHSNMHLVFSTKNRAPLITLDFEKTFYAYICGVCYSLKCPVHAINGMPDHIHILLEQSRLVGLSELVGKIKANSSRWAKTQVNGSPSFAWQKGYGYFGVGDNKHFDSTKKYILNQKEHHKEIGYQNEMRSAYKKLGINIDERYFWE